MTSKFKAIVASSLAFAALSGAAVALVVSIPGTGAAHQGGKMAGGKMQGGKMMGGKAGATNVSTKAVKDATKSEALAKNAIKGEEGVADPNMKVKRPAAKGGTKSRSGEGILHVDSRVSDPVAIYVDGRYYGTVSAYGDLYFTADPDSYEVFGKCGHGYTWGPKSLVIYSGSTRKWTLTE